MERYTISDNHEMLSFFKIPRAIENEYYSELSHSAKWLYLLFLDRMELSYANNWADSNGDIYFYFTVEEIQQKLKVGSKLAMKYKKELVKYGLLEEVRQGLGKPNKLYLGKIKNNSRDVQNALLECSKVKSNTMELLNEPPRMGVTTIPKVSERPCNYNLYNYNLYNYNKDIDDDIIQNKKVSSDKVEQNNTSSITEKKDPINWELIKITWNSIKELKPITRITDGRKKKIKTRMKNNAIDQTKLIEVINSINNSDFLRGLVNGWVITFDWLIKNDENFAKVMEGQYQNKGGVKKNGEPTNKYPEYQRAIEESERIARERMLRPIEWEEGEEPF